MTWDNLPVGICCGKDMCGRLVQKGHNRQLVEWVICDLSVWSCCKLEQSTLTLHEQHTTRAIETVLIVQYSLVPMHIEWLNVVGTLFHSIGMEAVMQRYNMCIISELELADSPVKSPNHVTLIMLQCTQEFLLLKQLINACVGSIVLILNWFFLCACHVTLDTVLLRRYEGKMQLIMGIYTVISYLLLWV